jgi:hypothetical protein
MHLLIDTNVFIYREDDRIISQNISDLFGLLTDIPVDIFVHPASMEDILRDIDQRRRDVMLSKIGMYKQLPSPPLSTTDNNYQTIVGLPKTPQDKIDNEILYAVYRGAIDFLITEDAGIHRKAYNVGVGDRVLHIDDAFQFFRQFVPKKEKIPSPPALKESYMYNLDLADPIFDSLKREYPEFEGWFLKKSREHRKCYVSYRSDGKIGALLIYKIENELIDIIPPLPQKERLKIATLKVTHVGNKIGERLLKLSVDLAIQSNCDEIYLTHYTEENDRLVELITEYGFEMVGMNSRCEEIFLKKMIPGPQDIAGLPFPGIFKKYYPSFYDGSQVKKWIVPIYPEYHDRLFTDYGERQTTLFEHEGGFIVEGNAIKKAYLSHSSSRQLRPGDVLIFYRTTDEHSLTALGIIEEVRFDVMDTDEIIRFVGKRTVYSHDEIEGSKKPITVILFRYHFLLKTPINLDTLLELGLLSGHPQSIMQINDEKYRVIKEMGGIDGRFTIN